MTLRKGLLALSPAIIFILIYVGISLVAGDFYIMPVTVALIAASVWGVIIMRGTPLQKRIEVFSKGVANSDIIYMLWIFILAGAFAAMAKEMGAIDSTVNVVFKVFPTSMILPTCFFASCLISFAIGTSVGAVVALMPLTMQMAECCGASIPLFAAACLGGAFFGDNLSFISDTTIAATRTQGCRMNDKFRVNVWIVLPAALLTLILYSVISDMSVDNIIYSMTDSDWWLVIPYLAVIVTAVAGLNVIMVLIIGIVACFLGGSFSGISLLSACGIMGRGIDSMGQLIIITLLASGMLGIVKHLNGIDFLLSVLTKKIHRRGEAKWSIAGLVGLVNICTANNTIAILTVGPLARRIATRFNISPAKSASLLDTGSCIVQCLIPYGAQCLLAAGLAGVTPGNLIRYLYYPWLLLACVAIAIMFNLPHEKQNDKIISAQ